MDMQAIRDTTAAVADPAPYFDPLAIQQHVEQAAGMLKLLANPVRLRILCQLAEQERTVAQLNEGLPALSQSALSQHLARLRRQRLVTTRRQGQRMRYALASGPAQAVLHTLYAWYCTPAQGVANGGAKQKEAP